MTSAPGNASRSSALRNTDENEVAPAPVPAADAEAGQESHPPSRRRESRFREFIDALPVAIYTTDADGRLTHFNPAAVALSGHTPTIGKDRWCVTWKLYNANGTPLPLDQCPMAIALKQGKRMLGMELIAERPDGKRCWVTPYPSPLHDAKGRVTGGINLLIDITDRKLAEQERDHERELLRTIIDRIPVMVTQHEPGSGMLKVNQEFERVFGWPSNEPLDRDRLGDDYDAFIAFLQSCPDGWTDLRMRPRDRDEMVASWANVTLSDGTEVGIGIDMSHRQHVEQSLARRAAEQAALYRFSDRLQRAGSLPEVYEASLDAIIDALGCDRASILLFDECGVMRFVAWRGLTDAYRHAVEGHSPWGPEEQAPPPICIGDVGPADISAELRAAVDAEGLGALGFIPLIAENKLIGKFMIYYNAPHDFPDNEINLAQTIGRQLAFGIESRRIDAERLQAEDALREANQRKDEFLATLAHELRNPLAPIRNSLEIIKRVDHTDVVYQQAHSTIERQTSQLVRLVDDLLDVSRISRNTFELRKERIDLSAVFCSALETSGPLIAEAGQQLTVSLPPEPMPIDADPMRLAQVFSNLLNNAAKYSDRGGHIYFTGTREADDVVVRVRDTGIGIAPELLPRIFDMFVQGDRSLERARSGMGIGLTLVHRLVEMHGGRVEVFSEGVGCGSEFAVRLPLVVALSSEAGHSRSGTARMDGMDTPRRVLIADDNRDAAESLATLLQLTGHEVAIAYDGLAAVEQAASFRPEVALLDLGMPKLNGYDAARQILEQHGKRILLVALTGWGQEQDRRRTRDAGFVHHLVKPLDLGLLQRLLRDLPRDAAAIA